MLQNDGKSALAGPVRVRGARPAAGGRPVSYRPRSAMAGEHTRRPAAARHPNLGDGWDGFRYSPVAGVLATLASEWIMPVIAGLLSTPKGRELEAWPSNNQIRQLRSLIIMS